MTRGIIAQVKDIILLNIQSFSKIPKDMIINKLIITKFFLFIKSFNFINLSYIVYQIFQYIYFFYQILFSINIIFY